MEGPVRKNIILAGYKLTEHIGGGSTAEVWKAMNTEGQAAAIKVFGNNGGLRELERNQIQEELKRVADLDHPNLVVPKELGRHGKKIFFVMRLCDGSTVDLMYQKIQAGERNKGALFSEEMVARILRDTAMALVYLKSKSTLHLDIKPANILFKGDGENRQYYISDFGSSVKMRQTVPVGKHGGTGFSGAYAAPELLNGRPQYKSDIFSLGVALFEIATGGLPTQSPYVALSLAAGAEINSLPVGFSRRFANLLKRCLSISPGDRPEPEDLLLWSGGYLDQQYWSAELKSAESGELLQDIKDGAQGTGQKSVLTNLQEYVFDNLLNSKLKPAANNISKSIGANWKVYGFAFAGLLFILLSLNIMNSNAPVPEQGYAYATYRQQLLNGKPIEAAASLEEHCKNNYCKSGLKRSLYRLQKIKSLSPFLFGSVSIATKDGIRWGVVDTMLLPVIRYNYDSIRILSENYFLVWDGYLCNVVGRATFPFGTVHYDSCTCLPDNNVVRYEYGEADTILLNL
ncbi:MAG TPA: serine/threonine protein kinase [Bacteroidetes bacterium]|nr:serine/threonine protein kinase [Bacteroidota bacterium]